MKFVNLLTGEFLTRSCPLGLFFLISPMFVSNFHIVRKSLEGFCVVTPEPFSSLALLPIKGTNPWKRTTVWPAFNIPDLDRFYFGERINIELCILFYFRIIFAIRYILNKWKHTLLLLTELPFYETLAFIRPKTCLKAKNVFIYQASDT